MIIDTGKCLILVFSKCDKNILNRIIYINKLKNIIPFFNIIIVHFISSYFNIGINRLFFYINLSYSCSMKKISFNLLYKLLNFILFKNDKIWIKKKIKFKYINICGYNPIVIVIHGKNFDKILNSYKRYLINYFVKKIKLVGSPIFIIFKIKL